ncbi:RAMP superfamily CRISPR-associated protein [Cronbergia sp. UHCC 0137]|uniref:RAMP superfamily CRISPR-associated protein n=1 Tax=Cronbergia sp. UHCC 0137 TaxID=3110239 RepID=UPI002B20DC1F|nr:RAMP superfamily CRISPR-associated protein [Cronbergia sp. UHCC 0137]MEA5617962.1 RAMP superfamily CRISPR-associated protein [Cronbergia sp. UHCC 0137]
MTWKAYKVVFKLKSPLHIGCGTVGNLQRTRSYVTGKVLWGALTMRLTRNFYQQENKPAIDSEQYKIFGDKVNKQLAFTYFYPAIEKKEKGTYDIKWPWGNIKENINENESLFRRRFLSSYASTALVYPQQAAEEGLLHEVEFISPRTLDHGKQVFLVGYVFEKEGCDLKWKCACKRLQIGGERGYGWGDLQYVPDPTKTESNKLFNICDWKSEESNKLFDIYDWKSENGSILIQTLENSHLLAHTETTDTENLSIQGEIEPLVGREWRSHESKNPYAGQHIEKFCDPCWIPGSQLGQSSAFIIKEFGIWKSKTYNEKA